MQIIKWLTDLAGKNPFLFAIALLMIGILSLSSVVVYMNNELNSCQTGGDLIQAQCNQRIDSVTTAFNKREVILNEEVKTILSGVIADYKSQLDQQKNVNKTITHTIINNKKVIVSNRKKLKSLSP